MAWHHRWTDSLHLSHGMYKSHGSNARRSPSPNASSSKSLQHSSCPTQTPHQLHYTTLHLATSRRATSRIQRADKHLLTNTPRLITHHYVQRLFTNTLRLITRHYIQHLRGQHQAREQTCLPSPTTSSLRRSRAAAPQPASPAPPRPPP
ncbi:hypothetical protein PMIN06_001200 [Paraphaeosphaeria minitans]